VQDDEIHTGGCVCGAVRYRTRGKPLTATVCHCTFCQKRLASAFALIASFEESQVEITQGRLTQYEHRSDESGRWLRMRFCPACGTTVCHAAEARPGICSIAAGTFDDPAWLGIQRHIWVRSKLPWVAIPEGVAVYESAAPPPAPVR
jgi:hypothetical protein